MASMLVALGVPSNSTVNELVCAGMAKFSHGPLV
jgi:hypothetical protein